MADSTTRFLDERDYIGPSRKDQNETTGGGGFGNRHEGVKDG